MPDSAPRTTRPWKVIAEEVSHEQDPVRLSKLIEELNRALDEQGVGKPVGKPKPDGQPRPDGSGP